LHKQVNNPVLLGHIIESVLTHMFIQVKLEKFEYRSKIHLFE